MITSVRFSHKPLWNLLIDKDLKQIQTQDRAGLSPATMAKPGKGSTLTTDVLACICEVLDCAISDIREIVPVEPTPKNTRITKENAHVATH